MITVFEAFRAVALIAGFAVGVYDKKATFLPDIVFSSWVILLMLICPQLIGSTIVPGFNPLMEYILRELACWLLVPVLMMYKYRKSRDETIVGSLILAKSLGLVPLLVVMIHGQLTLQKLNNVTMWSGTFFFGCLCVFGIYQLITTRPSLGRREIKGALAIICRLNFLFLFVCAVLVMAFPASIFEGQSLPVRDHDIFFTRCIGAFVFPSIFPAWFAPSFRQNEDRKYFFSCLILITALMTGAQLYGHFWEKGLPVADLSNNLFGDGMLIALPLAGLVCIMKQERDTESGRSHYNFRSRKAD